MAERNNPSMTRGYRTRYGFNAELEDEGIPVTWNGHSFYSLRCDQLLRLIKLFHRREPGLYSLKKVGLCERLYLLRPDALTGKELRAMELILQRGDLADARRILDQTEDQSDGDDTEPLFHTSAQPRCAPALTTTNYPRDTQTGTPSVQTWMMDDRSLVTEERQQSHTFPTASPRIVRTNDFLGRFAASLMSRTCHTCTEEKQSGLFPSRSIVSECKHAAFNICATCFSEYIQVQSDAVPLDEIRCPEDGCSATLSYLQMKQHAPATIFERYDTYIGLRTIQGSADYVKCANKTCDMGGIVDEATTSFLICPKCGIRTCFTCKTADHPNMSHDENQANIRRLRQQSEERLQLSMRKVAEEEHTAWTVERVTKTCPNKKCSVKITKDGGCDHMTCSQCKHEFCWLCTEPYEQILEEGNHMHRASCEHYRRIEEDDDEDEEDGMIE